MVHNNSNVSEVKVLFIFYDIHIDFIWQIPTNAGKKPEDYADTFIRLCTQAYVVVNNQYIDGVLLNYVSHDHKIPEHQRV